MILRLFLGYRLQRPLRTASVFSMMMIISPVTLRHVTRRIDAVSFKWHSDSERLFTFVVDFMFLAFKLNIQRTLNVEPDDTVGGSEYVSEEYWRGGGLRS